MNAAVPGQIDFAGLREIAVFRALQLGDLLCTVPALRALRAAAPQARITLIGLPWASSFVERFSRYVDDYMRFPGFPGFPETEPDIAAIPDFFRAAQARKFDLAIQLHGSGGLSNPLVVALGAARVAGFHAADQYCPDHRYFAQWLPREHEVHRYLRLLAFLGIEGEGGELDERLEFPLMESDYAALREAGIELPASAPYVCIHPGARLPSRRWSPLRFAQVADRLAEQGFRVYVTGSSDESEIAHAVVHAMRAPAVDMSGRTSLGALAALIAHARLVVCNDTGISHVAAGVATPSVVVCSGADPVRWAPLDHARHRVFHADVPCRPCAHVTCPIGHPCAALVGVEPVLTEALRLCGLHGAGSDAADQANAAAQPSSMQEPPGAAQAVRPAAIQS